MLDLQAHLQRLVSSFPKWGGGNVTWSEVLFLDYNDLRPGNPAKAARGALRTLAEYSPTFARHLEAGYPWINLNAYGVFDATLIVVVERPVYPPADQGKTSVNLSGPPIIHERIQWDLRTRFEILE